MLIKKAEPDVVAQFFEQLLRLVTHDKVFHTDDCMATAILLIVFGSIANMNIELIRTRKEELLDQYHEDPMAIVYDVGGKDFDHHNTKTKKRTKTKTPYAASGLVWKTFGRAAVNSFFNNISHVLVHRIWKRVDSELMERIDNHDINGCPIDSREIITLQHIVNGFRHHWYEKTNDEMEMVQFLKATSLCKELLSNKIFEIYSQIMACDTVKEAVYTSDNDILVIDTGLPWMKSYFDMNCHHRFIILPGNGTNWNIQPAPVKEPSEEGEKFPDIFRGLKNVTLSEVSGVDNMAFCSNNGHLAIAKTKEAAMEFAKRIMDGEMKWPVEQKETWIERD